MGAFPRHRWWEPRIAPVADATDAVTVVTRRPMATLICGVGDSPEDAEALRVAARLSNTAGLRLVVVHVEDTSGPGSAHQVRAQQRGRRLLDRVLAQQALGGRADTRVEVGAPAEELARVAAEEAATLILLGSPTRHCLRRRRTGRLTAELAATTDCPVVVVPAPPTR
jgi:nucleotide-binding universal stress UspA family protein